MYMPFAECEKQSSVLHIHAFWECSVTEIFQYFFDKSFT